MRAILTYHSIDPSGSPISIAPETFERHVVWLSAGPVRVTDVESLLEMPEEANAVAVTFDDGFRNFATEAWPRLRDRGVPVSLFVVAGRVGASNRWNEGICAGIPELPLLSWDELGRLAEEGVALESHGLSHRVLAAEEADRLRQEIRGSGELIEERTGVDPRGFAYPFGEHDEGARSAVAQSYDWACTTRLAPLDGPAPRYALPRLDMYYFRVPETLDEWGSRRFRWRVRLRRWGRRAAARLRTAGGG